jgi:hypothetical protein
MYIETIRPDHEVTHSEWPDAIYRLALKRIPMVDLADSAHLVYLGDDIHTS